jgi:hypothetical protein
MDWFVQRLYHGISASPSLEIFIHGLQYDTSLYYRDALVDVVAFSLVLLTLE